MTFSVPIDPARAPTSQQKGVRVVKGVPMFYKKKPLLDFEAAFTKAVDKARSENGDFRIPDYTPIFLHIAFLFGYPISTPKARRIDWSPMTQRPDGDNIAKAVIDCLGDRYRKEGNRWVVAHRGCFADDAAISTLVISKYRTTGEPRILVRVCARADWNGQGFA